MKKPDESIRPVVYGLLRECFNIEVQHIKGTRWINLPAEPPSPDEGLSGDEVRARWKVKTKVHRKEISDRIREVMKARGYNQEAIGAAVQDIKGLEYIQEEANVYGAEFNREMMDFATAKLLHEKGKFSTRGEADDWIEAWRKKETSISNLPPEKRKAALENLDAAWKEKIPEDSAIDKELRRQFMKILNSTEEMDQLRKELAKTRKRAERAEKELERVRKRRPPKRTAFPPHFIHASHATEKGLLKLARGPELQDDLLLKKNIKGMIDRGLTRMDLNVTEFRVVQGIFNLTTDTLTKEGYGPTPIRLNSWADLYRACGVREYVTEHGWMELDRRDKAKIHEAFLNLDKRNFDIVIKAFKGYDKKTDKRLYSVLATTAPLFKVMFFRDDVEEGKLVEVTEQLKNPTGEDPIDEIQIYPNPILLTNYSETFHRLIDSSLYHDIKGLLGTGQRVSKYDMRFITWLVRHRIGTQRIETNMNALADELGMDSEIKKGNWPRIETRLLRTYKIAYDLGYLLEPAEHNARGKRGPKEIFILNPEKVVNARQKELPLHSDD